VIDFSRAIQDARGGLLQANSLRSAVDYVDRIKTLTQMQIHDVDPDAILENTQYFNHSAIPDFVITWKGSRKARELFLRSSYADIVAADDVPRAGQSDSIFVALDSEENFDDATTIGPTDIQDEANRSSRALVSDVEAVGALTSERVSSSDPMAELVKQNFVSGARGWISEARATELLSSAGSESTESIGDLVRENFVESAVVRMERTAAILDFAAGRIEDEHQDRILGLLSGKLSDSEIRVILPWLLENSTENLSPIFWRRLGGLVTLEDLERSYELFEDQDLTGLVAANAEQWKARRSYLGLSIEEEEAGLSVTRGGWRFRGKTLGLEIGSHRLLVASSGRKLPSREGVSSSPSWGDIEDSLSPYKLASVGLKGVTRSVKIDAETSDDIRQDVLDVTSSLSDSYSVTGVTVRLPAASVDEDPVDAVIHYSASTVSANDDGTLADLARVSLRTLTFRNPIEDSLLEGFLGTDAQAQDERGPGNT
jgi:hypothetical protein